MGLTVLDTGVVIGFLDQDDAFHQPAHAAIAALMRDNAFFAMSAVSYAELLTGVELDHHDASVVHGFLDDFSVGVLEVDHQIAEEAARIRARPPKGHKRSGAGRPRIKMPDALILATAAVTPNVEQLLVADGAFPTAGTGVRVTLLTPGAQPSRSSATAR